MPDTLLLPPSGSIFETEEPHTPSSYASSDTGFPWLSRSDHTQSASSSAPTTPGSTYGQHSLSTCGPEHNYDTKVSLDNYSQAARKDSGKFVSLDKNVLYGNPVISSSNQDHITAINVPLPSSPTGVTVVEEVDLSTISVLQVDRDEHAFRLDVDSSRMSAVLEPSASADNAAAIEIPSDKTDASDRDDKDEPMAQSSTNMKKVATSLPASAQSGTENDNIRATIEADNADYASQLLFTTTELDISLLDGLKICLESSACSIPNEDAIGIENAGGLGGAQGTIDIKVPEPLPLPNPLLGRRSSQSSDESRTSDQEKGEKSSTTLSNDVEFQSSSRYKQLIANGRSYLDHHYYLTREPEIVFPTAPTDAEKIGYIHTHRALFCAAGIFAFLCTSAGLWLFALSAPQFYWFAVVATVLQTHICLYHLMGLFSSNFDFKGHQEILERQPITEENAPTVDILLPCCKEPLEILENTYKYIKELEYPASRINVHVLDDGAMGSVKELACRYRFNYICRDDRPYLKKAGNLRWAFTRTEGEYFVIYDADFCPRSDFLLEIIPRMMDDPKVAITQTPQFFQERAEHTWIERGASQVQEMFYRWCQVNRNKWGASICVGSNAVYRREALIETGGTAEVGASEDVYTGFFAVSRGWKLSYVPLCLAAGISPDTPRAFFSQQIRWCQGSTSLFLSSTFWGTRMSRAQRLCYLSGMLYYWSAAISVFVGPLPGVFMIWIRPGLLKYYNLAFAIPSILYGIVVFRLWSRSTHSLAVQHIKIMQSYAYVSGLSGLIFGGIADWVPSGDGKAHGSNSYRNMRVLAICWTFAYQAAFISGCVYCVVLSSVMWYHLLPLLLLDTFNLYLTIPFLITS